VIIVLAACSSLSLPGAQSSSSQGSQTQGTPGTPNAQFPAQTVEDKLAVGTLKLKGTDNAITADQAKALLPLWKGVKSLAASSTTSTEELNSLYKQIEEAMTADQVQAIKDMSLTQDDFQALMKQYNITMPQRAQGTPGAQAGNQSGNSASGGATGSGGAGIAGGPGGGPGDMGGGMPPDMAGGAPQGSNGQASAQRTPGARPAGGGRPGGGMSTLFVDPLITLLQTRSGASGS
jgi:hypothetical protein